MASGAATGQPPDHKATVNRALSILDAFAPGEVLGVTEIARRTGLAKSTTHRFLSALEQRQVVVRSGGRYRLGLPLFELGNRVAVAPISSLSDIALPYAADLYAETRQTVHLGVLDRGQVVYVLKLNGQKCQQVPTRVGSRMPAYCTAIGKALLAHASRATVLDLLGTPLRPYTIKTLVRPAMLVDHLVRVKTEGVAWDREETTFGLSCVAAPILDHQHRAVAALSLAGRPGTIASYVSTVHQVSRRIAAELAEGS